MGSNVKGMLGANPSLPTMIMKFTKGEIAEIKDLYDGSWGSIRELAMLFDCSITKIKYLVNKEYRIYACKKSREWQKKNPEKTKELGRKSALKWYYKNK